MNTEKVFSLQKDGFKGHFYPECKHSHKAILYVGGAGCNEDICIRAGRFYAGQGYAVLVLGFYLWDGLEKELIHIPVDYAKKACDWLNSNGYREICMMGTSTGAGYTLLCASLLPQITRVIAVSPFDYVMEAMHNNIKPMGTAVYDYNGNSLPYSSYYMPDGLLKAAVRIIRDKRYGMKAFMRGAYETAKLNPESRIKIENINGDILLQHPDHDNAWPSDAACKRMKAVLEKSTFSHKVKIIEYKNAGHALGYFPKDQQGFTPIMRFAAFIVSRNEQRNPEAKAEKEKSVQDILDFLSEWET